jgi:hypothetical protein
MQPFSIRHGKALREQRIQVSMKERLRARLWMTLQEFNERFIYRPDPTDNWTEGTDLAEQTQIKLKRLLGLPELIVKTPIGDEVVDLNGYFTKGDAWSPLEVIEQFVEEVAGFGDTGKGAAVRFQREVNEAMVAFECPWRLSDGRFFQVDAEFLHDELVQKGEDVLRERGFEGAHDEFREAREDLSDGQTKDAILKAFKSFESTLKTVLDKHNGDVSDLLRRFREDGFMDDIPDAPAKALCKQVLASLATLRNELGGHGQGNAVVEVPRPYALLALHLAGALNQFIVDQYLRKTPPVEMAPQSSTAVATFGITDDELPF